MRRRLIKNYLLIILMTIGITVCAFVANGYSYLVEENEKSLLSRASVLADSFSSQEPKQTEDIEAFLKKQSEKFGLRLTFIDRNGNVLADSDSDADTMDNHRTRPEIRRAFRNGQGADHRYSETMGVEYYYAAVEVEAGNFHGALRVSEPAHAFQELIDHLTFSISVLILLSVVLAFVLVNYFTKKVTEPIEYMTRKSEEIAEGNYGGSILVDGEDEVARLARSFNKMTKTLKIEQERVESQREELASILSSMSSGIAAIDSGGKLLFYNQLFLELLEIHMGNQDLKGRSLYQYFRNEEILDVISNVEENESQFQKESPIEKDGEIRIILIKGTPLYRQEKKKVGTLLSLEDITKMKKLETMRTDFVSNVTHELKTPLTSIRGFVETLKEGAIDDPQFARRFLDIIDIEAERLGLLIQDILLLSEIESGTDTSKSMVKVEPVIDNVIELLEKKGKKNVQIVKEMEKPVTDFLCNENRLRQLIINLADNGLKYTNEGQVTIRCFEQENDLILQFVDTGVGIPKEHLPRLFERFYRVDKGRSRKQGGTGLGLSIVKHIVELYRGKISVESKPDKGSVFTVRLPYY
ncbi:MAG: ATP-binding protein [Lachnospiraceae bacterium]|nr:ATP-binding protein [Lachnospiraceae bacterium]